MTGGGIAGYLNFYRYATEKKNNLQMDLMPRVKANEVLRSETTVYLQVLKGNVPVKTLLYRIKGSIWCNSVLSLIIKLTILS